MAQIGIRLDDALKAQFTEVCEAMGISTSAAITLFIRQVIRDRSIPFQITADAKPKDTI